jgi:CBS domain-containing protein
MKASEVMSQPVITVAVDTPVRQAAALLAERAITAMPVVDGEGRLVGMVSEADLLVNRMAHDPRAHLRRDTHPQGGQPEPAHTVGEVMASPVRAMAIDADTADVVDLMLRHDVRSVPIVDGEVVVGIVSRRDLLRALVRDDCTIEAEIRTRLDSYGGHPGRWPVQVVDGVVTVGGPFGDETERRVVATLVRTVPGVSVVHTG